MCSAFESAASQFAELLQVSGSNTAGANYHTPFPFPQHTRTLSTKDFSVSPDPLPGLRPWTPLGDFRPPDLLNWPPPSSFSGSAPESLLVSKLFETFRTYILLLCVYFVCVFSLFCRVCVLCFYLLCLAHGQLSVLCSLLLSSSVCESLLFVIAVNAWF